MTRCSLAVLLLVVSWSCSTPSPAPQAAPDVTVVDGPATIQGALGKRVQVTGKAVNSKLSAAVDTGAMVLFCVELPGWPDTVTGRQVIVTGLLQRTDQYTARTDPATGAISQGTEGPTLVLRSVQYRLR